MRDQIAEYARLGWPLIPVHSVDATGRCSCGRTQCAAPGKHPRLHDWTRQATSDIGIIERWWTLWPDANVGLATGRGLIDIEVDAHHDGEEHLARLEQRLGSLPDTVTWRSGGGGAHRLFAVAPDQVIGNATSIGADLLEFGTEQRTGIDVRGHGGQAVLPPSRHASGNAYRWTKLSPETIEIAALPEAWIAYLVARASRTSEPVPPDGNVIPDGQRNSALARLAGAMRRVGMTEPEIVAALMRVNADRCRPPLTLPEVEHVAHSVARYEPDQVATAVAEGHWQQDAIVPVAATILTPSDLLSYQTEDDPDTLLGQRWICRRGTCLVVGQTGIGKSSFAVQAAITWALGLPLFGIAPSRPLRSLIIQAENDTGDLAEMFRGVVRGVGCEDTLAELEPRLRFVSETARSGQGFHPFARRLIDEHQPDLVWIDPLFAFLGGNASDQEVVSTFLRNGLGAIAQETGVAWMIVHHTNKPAKDPKSAPDANDYSYVGAGSAELANWARAVLVLRGVSDDRYELRAAKRGRRAGLVDSFGNASTDIFLQHGSQGICWERAADEDDEQHQEDLAEAERVIAEMAPGEVTSRTDLAELVSRVLPAGLSSVKTRGRRANRIYRMVLKMTMDSHLQASAKSHVSRGLT